MLARDLTKLLEGTADAAFAVDAAGLIHTWNRGAERLSGYPPSHVLGKPCAPLFRGRSSLGTEICSEPCSLIECAVLGREIPNYDMEVKTRSGRRVAVNVSILVLRHDRSNRHLVVHLMRDISQRRRADKLTERLMRVAHQLSALPKADASLPPAAPLTAQERRVVQLLAEGKIPSTVARELGINPRTLRNHLHHINLKLHTHSRLEAVLQATRRGLI